MFSLNSFAADESYECDSVDSEEETIEYPNSLSCDENIDECAPDRALPNHDRFFGSLEDKCQVLYPRHFYTQHLDPQRFHPIYQPQHNYGLPYARPQTYNFCQPRAVSTVVEQHIYPSWDTAAPSSIPLVINDDDGLIACRRAGCDRKFKSEGGLVFHYRHEHLRKLGFNFICTKKNCLEGFKTSEELRDHEDHAHPKARARGKR